MHICVQFFWITWWPSTILFNNLSICMNVLESMIYCSDFYLTSRLSSYFSCPSCAEGFDSVQGVHRARLLFSATSMQRWWRWCCLALATKTPKVRSFPSSAPHLWWLVWACHGHGAMTMVVALRSWPLCHVYAWLGCCSQSLHDGAVILCLFVRLSVSLVIIMLSAAYLMQT